MPREKQVGLVSALGAGFEIVKSLIQAVEKLGGSEEDVRQLLNPQLPILNEVARAIYIPTGIVWEGTVEIDYSLTYDQRVESYGMTFSQVPKLYPIHPRNGKAKEKLVLVRFGKTMEVAEAEKQLEKLGLKHSSIEEAIAFGEQYRHVIYKYGYVMSLGSAKFFEPNPTATEEAIPFYGKLGTKVYLEAPSLSWANPGNLTLSTHQFFNRTQRGCCILGKKKD